MPDSVMKYFKDIILLLIVLYNITAKAQDCIGKDFETGKNNLKTFFIKEGFTFDKEQKAVLCESIYFKSAVNVLFKEDVRITITRGKSNKIFSVLIYSRTKKVIDEIKSLLKYHEWKYMSKESSREFYTFNGLSFSIIEKRNNEYIEYGISIQK